MDIKNLQNLRKNTQNMINVTTCLHKKCKEQYMHSQNKYANELKILLQKKLNNKISDKEYKKLFLNKFKEFNKSSEKINLIECQFKKCYNETYKMVMHALNMVLDKTDKKKDSKKYSTLLKYKNKFAKKMTIKDLNELDEYMYGIM